jgi:arylsulfatase A-like enzyme
LHQQRINEVTQHLDLLPTILAGAGCLNQQTWVGDNLLHPVTQAKLNLLNNQLYSFRKDKMLVVNEDGSYSVWSAGTLVRLEQRLDLPMLTDALKRLPDADE